MTDEQSVTSTTALYVPGKIVDQYESCDGQVRWRNGRLEQLWFIHKIGTVGHIEATDEEWRVVPDVSDRLPT